MRKRKCSICGHWHMVDVSKASPAAAAAVVPDGWTVVGVMVKAAKPLEPRYVCDVCSLTITIQLTDHVLRPLARERRAARRNAPRPPQTKRGNA